MDLFALTETQFIRELIARQNENLHISYKDFVMQVYDLCRNKQEKGFAVSALLVVEVEISALQTATQREDVNNALVSFIDKALHFVRNTISHYKEVDFIPTGADELIDRVGLNWTANKTALIEIGYAFKVAKCFGNNISAKEIIQKLAKVFGVDMPDGYIYKKYAEMRTRGKSDSRTYFIDTLGAQLNDHMFKEDTKDEKNKVEEPSMSSH
ncbi:RteC domain-containing protein [Muribaculum sp.]|nr:RteC domain-containing protein [Muribaculum sp.]MCX4279346.1 RteC domain-containing protein [Muribaculum sp.]